MENIGYILLGSISKRIVSKGDNFKHPAMSLLYKNVFRAKRWAHLEKTLKEFSISMYQEKKLQEIFINVIHNFKVYATVRNKSLLMHSATY